MEHRREQQHVQHHRGGEREQDARQHRAQPPVGEASAQKAAEAAEAQEREEDDREGIHGVAEEQDAFLHQGHLQDDEPRAEAGEVEEAGEIGPGARGEHSAPSHRQRAQDEREGHQHRQ